MSNQKTQFHGYPLEDREAEDTGEFKRPDKFEEKPLKQIGGKPQRPAPSKKGDAKRF